MTYFKRAQASASAYLDIARPDHWFKNIFMLPGMALGILIGGIDVDAGIVLSIVSALVSTCLAASANYTINEWLDAEFDRFHPTKHTRPSVTGGVTAPGVYIQWAALLLLSIGLAYTVNHTFVGFIVALLVMGIFYNVNPFRTKDRVHLDVLTESINNPLRFMLGWCSVNTIQLPPSSILVAYWMGGAYLMTVKRYSEYRHIGSAETAALYRRSFRYYNENNLLLAAFFYALTAAFFIGVFLIKYRIEYILAMPLLALLFVWYLHMGMARDSVAQRPEKLYRETGFLALLAFTLGVILLLTFIDIPVLGILLETRLRH